MYFIWLLLALGPFGVAQEQFAMGQSRGWLQPHHKAAIDEFMSLNHYSIVAARSYEDLDWEKVEEWFCVGRDRMGAIVAEVRRPVRYSILDQLMWRHMDDLSATFEELIPSVEIERVFLSDRNCADLRTIVESFPALEPDFDLESGLSFWLHPRVIEAHATGSGLSVLAQASSPSGDLVLWFRAALARLEYCLESAAPGDRHVSMGSLRTQQWCAVTMDRPND